jgi:hypothetical protein
MNEEECMNSGDLGSPEIAREVFRRKLAKVVVVALAVAGLMGTGLSGALASHGADDGAFYTPSGSSATSASSGGSGWDDGSVFSPGSGSGWDDGWDDSGWDDD